MTESGNYRTSELPLFEEPVVKILPAHHGLQLQSSPSVFMGVCALPAVGCGGAAQLC